VSPTVWAIAIFGVVVSFLIASFTNVVIDRLPVALDEPRAGRRAGARCRRPPHQHLSPSCKLLVVWLFFKIV
jgi:hypothetical protein